MLKQLTGTYEKLVGSILRLKAWMRELDLQDYQPQIKFLRTGHRKGYGYQKISKVFDVQKGNYREAFISIFEQASSFLNYIEQNKDIMKTGLISHWR